MHIFSTNDSLDSQLDADCEDLQAQPLITKFGDLRMLKKTTIIGIKHQATLAKLREGLAAGPRKFVIQREKE